MTSKPATTASLCNAFRKAVRPLADRHDTPRVFNDFLTMAICSHHRTNIQSKLTETDAENEALYLKTIKGYSKDELHTFAELTSIVYRNTYHNPYSDLLGEYYMDDITKGQNGQYFTPAPITDLMATIQLPAEQTTGKRIADPACGSGRTLLSAAKHQPDNYFYGADVNSTCAKMATVNFFLNGLRGEVSWMDSLSNAWYGGWHINTNGLGIVPLQSEEESVIILKPPAEPPAPANVPPPPPLPERNKNDKPPPATQLNLF